MPNCVASAAVREALFIYGFAKEDFGLLGAPPTSVPTLWSDRSTALTASKRISPGSKLKHLEVCEFYVQSAPHAGKIKIRKVKRTSNPGNFLTKHAKGGPEVVQTLPSLAIVDVRDIAGSTAVTKSTVKVCQGHQGKRPGKLERFSPKRVRSKIGWRCDCAAEPWSPLTEP